MSKRYSVYKHTNNSNGKVYIGVTSLEPKKRWRNGLNYKHNRHFNSAINKYGWSNFKHEILYKGLSRRKASLMESRLIKEHNALNPAFGYNKFKGGIGKGRAKRKRQFGTVVKELFRRIIKKLKK